MSLYRPILHAAGKVRFGVEKSILVLRKKGGKTKKRMKEEELDTGDRGPPTRYVFFEILSDLNQAVPIMISQTRIKRVSRMHHRTILDSRLRGDQVPLGSSPTKSQKC